MAESLSVNAKLVLESNVPALLRKMLEGFEDISTKVARFQEQLNSLGSKSGGVGRLAETLTKVADIKLGAGLADSFNPALAKAKDLQSLAGGTLKAYSEVGKSGFAESITAATEQARDLQTLASETRTDYLDLGKSGFADSFNPAISKAKELESIAQKTQDIYAKIGNVKVPTGRSSSGGSKKHSVTAVDVGIAGTMVGDAGLDLATAGFMANMNVVTEQATLSANKLNTPAVRSQVGNKIQSLQKANPSLTQMEGLQDYADALGVFGDPKEALAAMPAIVHFQQLQKMRSTDGTDGGNTDQVLAAIKSGDIMQSFIDPKTKKFDVGMFNQFMAFQQQSLLAGNGIVTPKSWLAFARSARVAGMLLDPQALAYSQALLEQSPGRSGTAMSSAFQLFGNGNPKMLTDKNRAAWEQVGLLDKNGKPVNDAQYQKDPFEWVWNTLEPKLRSAGYKTEQQQLSWIAGNMQRSTIAGLFSDIIAGETGIKKTAGLVNDQQQLDLNKTPAGQLAAFQAGQQNFLVALGKFESGPGIKILNSLTDAFNGMANWANKNPGLAKYIVEIGGGFIIFSKAAGTLANVVAIGGPLVRGFGGLALVALKFAKGAGAAEGLANAASGLSGLASEAALFAKGGVAAEGLLGLAAGITAITAALAAAGYVAENQRSAAFKKLYPNDPAAQAGAIAGGVVTPATQGDKHKSIGEWGKLGELFQHVTTWISQGSPVTVSNPRDIANGTAAHIKKQLQAPNTGPSGYNGRATPPGSAALTTAGQ
jgi:hypothetical protein